MVQAVKHSGKRGWDGIILLGLVIGLLSATLIPGAPAQGAVVWPVIHLQLVSDGLSSPVGITHAGDGSGRLYVVEQGGTIRIIQNGNLQSATFLDIHTLVSCCGERGLLGLAFPPNYAARGHFFVYYTRTDGDIVVARYNVSANRNLADASSEVVVLTIDHSTFDNHNGGQLSFGPDGYLYLGVGDGGSGGDPDNHGQSLNTLLGKILRIDVEKAGCVQNPPKAQNYCIPPTNPSNGSAVWAYGLRNPWRFSFDRLTNDLYIGDVGQDREEEIDFQPASSGGGENYGWRILEGTLCYNPMSGCMPPPAYHAPVAVYDHGVNDANGCAVTGGYVYRGPNIFLDMQGVYFYADYCLGKIFGLKNSVGWQTQLLLNAPFSISSFGEDESGYLYLADYSNGAVYLIEAAIDQAALPNHFFLPMIQR
ncbi:MAG TPA: PQQ-dependent sugar dehydrogenase [Anaerolineaceae bacterium]|nr:PQQ-dependent sugar dehydrogenase [Anaerolineaceae bacterium]